MASPRVGGSDNHGDARFPKHSQPNRKEHPMNASKEECRQAKENFNNMRLIHIEYWAGPFRAGALLWQDGHAVGGFDFGGGNRGASLTIVRDSAAAEPRYLAGFVHPDDLEEVSGRDGMAVVECGPELAASS